MGSPVVGCQCAVCKSKQLKNQRLRPSLLLTINKKRYLVDVGPDFRQQALRHNINDLDGILLTHSHYDHIGGLDELRIFYFLHKKKLPCLISKETFQELQDRYHYLLRPLDSNRSICAQLDFHQLDGDEGSTSFDGLKLDYFSYTQAQMKVSGFRFGDFAYVTDIKEYDASIFNHLKNLNTLVVSALRQTPSPVNFNIDQAIEFGLKVSAKQTYFTHLSHDIDHDECNQSLPPGFSLAYDGMQQNFEA